MPAWRPLQLSHLAWALGVRDPSLEVLSIPTASVSTSAHVMQMVSVTVLSPVSCVISSWASQRQPELGAEQTPFSDPARCSGANPDLPSPSLMPQASPGAGIGTPGH